MSLSNSQTSNHFSIQSLEKSTYQSFINQSLEKFSQVIIYPINLSKNQPINHLPNQYLE